MNYHSPHSLRPQKILFLSDAHIGAKTSNFASYQARIIELMTHYDHVCLIGDNWELFFIDKRNHIELLSNLLEVLSDKPGDQWKKDFSDKGTLKSGVQNVIHAATWFTDEFLQRFPNVHLHVIGGNHESVRRFHNEFAKLQTRYPQNFEWSPEAIRIGDALITHGHLPVSGQGLDEYPIARLREAAKDEKWRHIINYGSPLEHAFQRHLRPLDRAVKKIIPQFKEWEKTGAFSVSHEGVPEPLSLTGIKHIFFGHTHIKFDNLERDGISFHNTGALVRSTSKNPDDLGILEADLNMDGSVTNVRPVEGILKDGTTHRVKAREMNPQR